MAFLHTGSLIILDRLPMYISRFLALVYIALFLSRSLSLYLSIYLVSTIICCCDYSGIQLLSHFCVVSLWVSVCVRLNRNIRVD